MPSMCVLGIPHWKLNKYQCSTMLHLKYILKNVCEWHIYLQHNRFPLFYISFCHLPQLSKITQKLFQTQHVSWLIWHEILHLRITYRSFYKNTDKHTMWHFSDKQIITIIKKEDKCSWDMNSYIMYMIHWDKTRNTCSHVNI